MGHAGHVVQQYAIREVVGSVILQDDHRADFFIVGGDDAHSRNQHVQMPGAVHIGHFQVSRAGDWLAYVLLLKDTEAHLANPGDLVESAVGHKNAPLDHSRPEVDNPADR